LALLVTIDNGGTLTDLCASDGGNSVHTKTLTTPHDLAECFTAGLQALADQLYGEPDLARLVSSIEHLRYSTTQGTNALVQRRGPQLGWLADDPLTVAAVREAAPGLFELVVGERLRVVADPHAEASAPALVRAAAELVSAGASRVVVGFAGETPALAERVARRVLYRAFPRHLLGAVPLLFASELGAFGAVTRRVWAALVNAFLHPAMEQFLYNADNRLRAHRARRPLLVFRNDGDSTRVARTVALRTWSSGPQGGVVGAEALLAHYGIARAVSMDIGGTTTDIAPFEDGRARVRELCEIEGAPMPFPLAEVHSIGAGGGSVVRVREGRVHIGPDSVGSAPGPACFGRGGSQATLTDALLLEGVLDARAFFGGRLVLDAARAARAMDEQVAVPLGCGRDAAIDALQHAYHAHIARALPADAGLLLAFGGAGPMSACGVAEAAGIDEVLVPRQAAVFCAWGIGFSGIRHTWLEPVAEATAQALAQARVRLLEHARRGMLAEGFALAGCTLGWQLLQPHEAGCARRPCAPGEETPAWTGAAWLELEVLHPIPSPLLGGSAVRERRRALPEGLRPGRAALPLYRFEALAAGDWGEGPCLVEEAYFTTHVRPGWRFVLSDNADLFLRRTPGQGGPRPPANPAGGPWR
jgi:N-methylhydantoinase A/oxoprolinase/acetone carboxylase beta subunit